MFESMLDIIHTVPKGDFKEGADRVRKFIDEMELSDFKEVVKNIGIIPENIYIRIFMERLTDDGTR